MSDQVLIFIHQPKAGGMTLKTIAQRGYKKEQIYQIEDVTPETVQVSLDQLRALPDAAKRQLGLVMGHMPMGVHQFLPQKPVYFTMLRDPVERSISHYYHLFGHSRNWGQAEIVNKKATLEEYLTWTDSLGHSNLQTRCVLEPEAEIWDHIARPHPPLDPALLPQAKENLEKRFAAVGTLERFDESLLTFKKIFGWRNIYYGRVNVTKVRKPRTDIAPETIARIEKLNYLDIELWKFADELLSRQIAHYGPTFEKDLHHFKVWNERYIPIRKLSKAIDTARETVQLRTRLKRMLTGA